MNPNFAKQNSCLPVRQAPVGPPGQNPKRFCGLGGVIPEFCPACGGAKSGRKRSFIRTRAFGVIASESEAIPKLIINKNFEIVRLRQILNVFDFGGISAKPRRISAGRRRTSAKKRPPRPAALAPHALFRKAKLSGRGWRKDTIKAIAKIPFVFLLAHFFCLFIFVLSIRAETIQVLSFGSQPTFSSIFSSKSPRVKFHGLKLQVDKTGGGNYENFLVKGIGYAPFPIGTFPSEWGLCKYTGDLGSKPQFNCAQRNIYDDPAVLERDLPLIKAMHANTIRTWGKVSSLLLQKARQYDLKVIAGFWVNYDLDFTNPDVRANLIEEFKDYVNTFKDDPALLMWGLSNENNTHFCSQAKFSCNRESQAKAFYKLINAMARAAHEVEGTAFHPVMVVHSELGDIGKKDFSADDDSLAFVDVHGINAYRGKKFGEGPASIFRELANRSKKPMIITEFGTDAWFTKDPKNPKDGEERQDLQAQYIASNWDDIIIHSISEDSVNNGGIVLIFTDDWWQQEGSWSASCAAHDYGYMPHWSGNQPDGYANQEWWGMAAVEPVSGMSSLPSRVTLRKAYYELQKKFASIKN